MFYILVFMCVKYMNASTQSEPMLRDDEADNVPRLPIINYSL